MYQDEEPVDEGEDMVSNKGSRASGESPESEAHAEDGPDIVPDRGEGGSDGESKTVQQAKAVHPGAVPAKALSPQAEPPTSQGPTQGANMTAAHEQVVRNDVVRNEETAAGLGQAARGTAHLDLEHHSRGVGRKAHPGLVPARGRSAYGDGVTTEAGGQSVTTGGLGQAVHGHKDLDLLHHTKGLGRRPHPGLVPAKGRTAYGAPQGTGPGRRGRRSLRSLRERMGLNRSSTGTSTDT